MKLIGVPIAVVLAIGLVMLLTAGRSGLTSAPLAAGPEGGAQKPVVLVNGATAEFTIDGMHCSLCAANLARVLQEQPGVAAARVDLDKKLALVQYDATNTTVEQIEKTIEETGVFRAELVSRPVPQEKK